MILPSMVTSVSIPGEVTCSKLRVMVALPADNGT